jgi:hypothetical protein
MTSKEKQKPSPDVAKKVAEQFDKLDRAEYLLLSDEKIYRIRHIQALERIASALETLNKEGIMIWRGTITGREDVESAE